MKHLVQSLAFLIPVFLIPKASAADIATQLSSFAAAPAPTAAWERPVDYRRAEDQPGWRAWKRSVIPVLASQGLDMASSFGMRERNPVLAGGDGRFGMRAVAIKGGAVAAILGIEYLVAKKYPRAARVISRLNWSSSVVTGAFAAHNFAIR
jgi:hypothetical protein